MLATSCCSKSLVLLRSTISSRRCRLLATAAAAVAASAAAAPSAKSPEAPQAAADAATSMRAVKVTSAIRAYLKSAEKYDKFMRMERENFELGKRFLAGMMGVPVSELTEENIEKAINYLFPSGLTHYRAKPHMSVPQNVFPKEKALQCDYNGRPNHSMFYTKQPNFYQLLSDIAWKVEQLKQQEDSSLRSGIPVSSHSRQLNLASSHWLEKKPLEALLLEKLSEAQYKQLIASLNFLAGMPLSASEAEFLMSYRRLDVSAASDVPLPELQLDKKTQRYFSEAYGQRKWATAFCRLYNEGTGKFTVNGESLLEAFPWLADRETLASPLVLTGTLGKVDIEATVTVTIAERPEGRVHSRTRVDDTRHMASQSGALRLAISRALACHLPSRQLRERLRMSGLLTPDMRLPERKYYGKSGPRDVWTWKAR